MTRDRKFLIVITYLSIGMLGIYISFYQYTILSIANLYLLNAAIMGLLIGVQHTGMVLPPLFLGVLSGKIGKKRVALISYLLLFSRDNRGFDCKITAGSDTLAFFTVPYEPGWTAEVNGVKAEIVKSNIGFMAVPVEAGINEIRFNYMTPGLIEGSVIALMALILILLYSVFLPAFMKTEKFAAIRAAYEGKNRSINSDSESVYPEGS